jgi:REP element-mobilizing transposase RayT
MMNILFVRQNFPGRYRHLARSRAGVLWKEAARVCRCAIHAYALMTNHVHLLLTPGANGSPARLMQSLGRRYVQYINRFYRRTGSLSSCI